METLGGDENASGDVWVSGQRQPVGGNDSWAEAWRKLTVRTSARWERVSEAKLMYF